MTERLEAGINQQYRVAWERRQRVEVVVTAASIQEAEQVARTTHAEARSESVGPWRCARVELVEP